MLLDVGQDELLVLKELLEHTLHGRFLVLLHCQSLTHGGTQGRM